VIDCGVDLGPGGLPFSTESSGVLCQLSKGSYTENF
jgi:hypothetical protein